MKLLTQQILSYFKPERKPADSGHLIALSGAILIGTEDGNNVVITPKMARDIAPLLTQLANDAEKDLPQAV